MGIDLNTLRLLAREKDSNCSFKRTLMLGRQKIILPSHDKALLASLNQDTLRTIQASGALEETYAESLFHQLGADEVHSMDASDYEKATLIHDLNKPIPEQWFASFDLVVDGGTLEHIFNVPIALLSIMNMVIPGGHLLLFTPANNLFGHGFYQFSPELYFSLFNEKNGYQIEEVLMYGFGTNQGFFRIKDPKGFSTRVTMRNSMATYLFVKAKRVTKSPIDALSVQQSDYEGVRWQGKEWASVGSGSPIGSILSATGLASLRKRLYVKKMNRKIGHRLYGSMPPEFYEEIAV